MTTLIVTSSWPRTGDELAGTFVRTDALVRAREGGAVLVAAPAGPGIARGGEGLTVIDVPHGGLFGSPGAAHRAMGAPFRLLGLLPFARALREILERSRPDAIVAHWLVPSGLVIDSVLDASRAASRGTSLELIAHGADVRFLAALPRPAARRILERVARRASRVRAVSEELSARLLAIAPALRAKTFVAPMPLATDDPQSRVHAQVAARGLEGGGRPLHVVASRLIASKRIERAIDHVGERGGRLVVIGDGPMRAKLSARARRAGIDARFVGARPHDETLAWIAAADVVLAPLAPHEGAPTAAREAESLGRTVIRFAARDA